MLFQYGAAPRVSKLACNGGAALVVVFRAARGARRRPRRSAGPDVAIHDAVIGFGDTANAASKRSEFAFAFGCELARGDVWHDYRLSTGTCCGGRAQCPFETSAGVFQTAPATF